MEKTANYLINEKSPYLQQHAYNPVEWYPWGEAAFKRAREEGKPIFLSVGYSTCHWCHVMEKESFETIEAAAVLNHSFIAIKVDREERPDIDAVYMNVCQLLNGSGGWPLTILMTPEQVPFFAGTYLPLHSKYGQTGLIELLEYIAKEWKINKEKLISSGMEIKDYIEKQEKTKQKEQELIQQEPTEEILEQAYFQLKKSFDLKNGGFGSSPKFPTPYNLIFLFYYGIWKENKNALFMAEKTLLQMYLGGIYDHIGSGFSRYSTDEIWLVPHFEKMLYDNALLILAYTKGYQITKHPIFKKVTDDVIHYVLRELTGENGEFFCGQDADSEGEEGKYYTFTKDEIKKVLGEDKAERFCKWYHITEQGNFEGKNIINLLHQKENKEHFCIISNELKEAGIIAQEESLLEEKKKLYEYRKKRYPLHKDDKVLTSWNCLMIEALANASFVFQKQDYLKAAKRAELFLRNNLFKADKTLYIRWKEKEAANHGILDDYAFYAFSLLGLYENTFEVYYLEKAIELVQKMIDLFWDEQNGGFYLYSKKSEQLITRPKETYDGAIPSGNGIAARIFVRLFYLTADIKWNVYKEKQLNFLTAIVQEYPAGFCATILAITEELSFHEKLLCVYGDEMESEKLAVQLKQSIFKQNLTIIVKDRKNQERLKTIAPFTEYYPIPEKGANYYICTEQSCKTCVDSELDVIHYFQH